MKDNVIKIDYTEEMEKSYIDYAMSVIIQRAIPDLRDGLKPVHRRILYAMDELNLRPSKEYKKSARIVGDVLGKYHPHGDSSVYEAMVRLAQDFNINHTLVKGQGNFGSIDGDSAAAMRYTEAKLDDLSEFLLDGLDKDIISFSPNFDNSRKEPEVLPAKFFNLLVNGSTGIAVGMSTNIPSHNLKEVINATKAFLKDEKITTKDLLKYIKGPDFPTGGLITNKKDLKNIYETGNGRIKIRAKFKVEKLGEGKKNLVITEVPYTFAGNKTRLLENLIDLINNGKLDEVSDISDESSKDGIRISLEVKRGVNIEKLQSKLYRISRLEDTIPVNMLSIVNGKPQVLSLSKMMELYVSFLIDLYKKEMNYDLNKLLESRELKSGFIKASKNIDLIIQLIRNSKNKDEVLDVLVGGKTNVVDLDKNTLKKLKNLKLTKKQGEAILKMQLQNLLTLELSKIEAELDIIEKKIDKIKNLLLNEVNLKNYIVEDLDSIKKKFSRNRKTEISQIEEEEYIEEVIVEDLYALIDKFNYLKVIDNQSYSRTNPETLEDYKFIVKIKSTDNLCIFDDKGNFNQYKMENIDISKMSDRGKPLPTDINLLYVDSWENIQDKEMLFITKNSFVKRVDSREFDTIRSQILSTRISEDDELIGVTSLDSSSKELVLITKNNRKLRFSIEEIAKYKRNAIGVIGMNLNHGDYVVKYAVEGKTEKNKRNRAAKGEVLE